jgi:signal transduction histidine kinase/ligand-binding sensor domain-containing protein
LPQNSVRGLSQTPDGYLWIATLNGIARFDGVRFTVFDKSNTPAFTSSRFTAMVRGQPGDFWAVSEDGNVIYFHEGIFRAIGQAEGIVPYSVTGVCTGPSGGIWVLSGDRILRWNAASGRFEPEESQINQIHFTPLWWIGTGFWGLKGNDLYWFRRGKLTSYTLPKTFPVSKIKKVAVGADGIVWIDLSPTRYARIIKGVVAYDTGTVETLFQGSHPNWKSHIDASLERRVIFPSDGTEKGISYNALIDDNDHNTWIGSEAAGLFRVQRQYIQVFSTARGLAGENVYPVLKSRNGDMWVGTWPAGLSKIREGAVTTYTIKDGLPGLVTSLAEDDAGNLWVGTHGGLTIFSNGHFRPVKDLPPNMPAVQAICLAKDGRTFLATARGVYILNGEKSRWLTRKDGLAGDDVHVIVQTSDDDIWIGGYGGLTQIHGDTLHTWTEHEGLPNNNVRSIYRDSNNDLWVGTYDGGLGRLRHGQWTTFNENNGLFNNGVFQILEDSQSNFWISSNKGIYRVSKTQLNEVAAGHRTYVDSIGYGRSDGMFSAECNGGLWPAGAKDDSGHLWFPTQNGVAVVEPEALSSVKQPPKIAIEKVSLEHTPQNSIDHIVVKPGQTNLEIQYTAVSFSKPEQISFRYKLDGVDQEWEDVGHRRTAFYTHLPSGEFVFRVMAINSDSVTSTADGTIKVTVIPPFYRRWWFLLATCALIIGIISALWNLRVRQLEQTQAAQVAFSQQLIASQESERRRIAAELHDGLGQRLIVINNLALFLLRPKSKADEESKQQTIREITSEASLAIDETRAISYGLRPFQLDRLGLSKAIQGIVRTASKASGIQITSDVADIDEVFPEDLRINFFRIVQEGLNNIIKHSNANHANVLVKMSPVSVILSIEDNGKGLSPDSRRVAYGPGGFGLTGLKERAASLNGSFKIRTEPGSGTLLTFEFPLRGNTNHG